MRPLPLFGSGHAPLRCSTLDGLNRCPMKYALMYLEGDEDLAGEAAATGSVAHAAVAAYHLAADHEQGVKAGLAAIRGCLDRFPQASPDDAARHFIDDAADPRHQAAEVVVVERPVRLVLPPAGATRPAGRSSSRGRSTRSAILWQASGAATSRSARACTARTARCRVSGAARRGRKNNPGTDTRDLNCIPGCNIIGPDVPVFPSQLLETRRMQKMKTLMSDDEPTGTAPGDAPAGAPLAVPGWDLLRELARPWEERVVRTDTSAPYVGFASSRSDTWDSLRQLHPKTQEGTPFVSMPDGQFEPADPLKLNLVRFKQCWSERDDQYRLARVVFTDPGRGSALTEEFLAFTVVHLGRRLVPAVSYFAGTKAGAVRKAADTLPAAGTPGWAGLSSAHAASANFPLPFGRFVTEVTIEPRTSRAGRPYQLAVGHVRPANLEELDALHRALQDDGFLEPLRVALDVFGSRLRTLEDIARNGSA
jgi:hypothetical protein